MEAPTYIASTAYERPAIHDYSYGTKSVSILELMNASAAWAIVLKHLPFMPMFVQSEDIKPALGNMSLEDLAVFTTMLKPMLPALDKELATLPRVPGKGA
ncbi:hypothetical protein [Sphingobium tyrosinilyticum]|uniref:Uncharacterized protein n=1 Tax=Sphingobium tyrosinilyticum TaxID=2715436 RepID=A0ABV9F4Q5_9SPHN